MSSSNGIRNSRALKELRLKQAIGILIVAFVAIGENSETSDDIPKKYGGAYKFGYKSLSKHGDQWRAEARDRNGSVIGSYGFIDDQGFRREVKYVADEKGFRVKVDTNEPGMKYRYNPANVILKTETTTTAAPTTEKPELSQKESEVIDFYTVYTFSSDTPPLYIQPQGHVQSPWFPITDSLR